jgi:hypothetical protein
MGRRRKPMGIPIPPHPVPHVEMKKHHHDYHLVISGKEGADVTKCVQSSITSQLITAFITAAAAAQGHSTQNLAGPLINAVKTCLGQDFTVEVKDQDGWVTWLA